MNQNPWNSINASSIKIPTHRHGHTLDLIITLANTTLNPIITSSYIVTSYHYPIFTNIHVHPNHLHFPHQQPSPIVISTPLTTPNLLMTSSQVLSSQTRPAVCPTYSTHILQLFAHYLIITPSPHQNQQILSHCSHSLHYHWNSQAHDCPLQPRTHLCRRLLSFRP